jgi:hypothetical protein
MLKKYESFLESKIKWEMFSLLEGYIYGTTDFVFRLKELSSGSGKAGEISKNILSWIEDEHWFEDKDIKQNYFDQSSEDDKVSFAMYSKVLSADYDEDENPDFPYTMPGRGEMKIGRIIRYLYGLKNIKLTDTELEEFVNVWKSSKVEVGIKFKLVSGKDIAKYYDMDKYYNSVGSLGGSCMAEEKKSLFKLYTKNPDKVKLLIYVDGNDKIHGRALVWKVKESPCDSKYFMDRIYTNRDSDVNRFKSFADSQGWFYKKINNSHIKDNVRFMYKGSNVNGVVTVKLDGDFNEFPFLDTLCYLGSNKKSVSNVADKNSYILQSTYGDYEICSDCDGDVIETWGGRKNLCDDCAEGHITLKTLGIETKWNKKVD